MKKFIFFFILGAFVVSLPFIVKKARKIYKNFLIHEHGYWVDNNVKSYFDEPLAQAIASFLRKERAQTIVDLGCGAHGDYVKYLRKQGFVCDGYDGNPYSPEISQGLVGVLDLSQEISLAKKYDWVISLEVGEHIPAKYEKAFIDNLHRHNTQGIILSWAIENQKGRGHFNCRNNDYIKNIFAKHGYENDVEMENHLRQQARFGWLHNTIMVFRKRHQQ